MRTSIPAVMKMLVATMVMATAGVQAAPVVFSSMQYDTTAFAISGATADLSSDASPSPLPLLSSATVVGANDFATAFALAASGLLTTSAEADGFSGAIGATAGAQSHFVGAFSANGPLTLNFDFDNLTSTIGGGSGAATLFVLVSNVLGGTTTTVFSQLFTVADDIAVDLDLKDGINTLDLLLFSDASTTGAGQAGQNFSQVTFSGSISDGTVPIPATLPLVVVGLVALSAASRQALRRRLSVSPR